MALTPDTLSEITAFVRGGFEDRDRIVEILCEEMYEPGELDADEVEHAVDAAFAALAAEKRSWPARTDCDRLDAVFDALPGQGIIALQNAGYTQSDGYDDIREAHRSHPQPRSVVGYCFYHGQDLERAVRGGGLYLAFGPIDPAREQTDGVQVGTAIVGLLQAQGFDAEWNGSFDQRIFVPKLDWKRR